MDIRDFIVRGNAKINSRGVTSYKNSRYPGIELYNKDNLYEMAVKNGRLNESCLVNVEPTDNFESDEDHFFINHKGRSIYFHLKRSDDKDCNYTTLKYFIKNILPKDLEHIDFELKRPTPIGNGFYTIPLGKLYSNSPKRKINKNIKNFYDVEIESYDFKDGVCELKEYATKPVPISNSTLASLIDDHFYLVSPGLYFSDLYPFLKITETNHRYRVEDSYVGDYIEAYPSDLIAVTNYGLRVFIPDTGGENLYISYSGNPYNKVMSLSKAELLRELTSLITINKD